MKAKQVHEMSMNELVEKLAGLKEELFNLRFRHATGQLSNPLPLRLVKRDIARVKTVIREKELAGETVPVYKPVKAAKGKPAVKPAAKTAAKAKTPKAK
jgi:large subunit ribosomal protein L29